MKKDFNKIYAKHGYRNRKHYFMSLARKFDMELFEICVAAEGLKPKEYFTVLPLELEDKQYANFG